MFTELEKKIPDCLLKDQQRFFRDLMRLRTLPIEQRVPESQKLMARVERSEETVKKRASSIPAIAYPESLPISEKRVEIANAIRNHQIVVIAGETGSGKTTQIPKICLELGLGVRGLIGHTQPRRLAARAVASRIADELGQVLGRSVGYQVRFDDVSSDLTLIKLMTDGILLAEIQQDKLLAKYEVIIIDEAHERSLNIDFLLGYLKRISVQRPDLKIIITSATIDVEKFSRHFSDAPIISVSGRTFPVDVIYQDPVEFINEEADDDQLLAGVLRALRTFETYEREHRQPAGDVLVFLSGERDIRELAIALRKQELRHTEVLPLYARLTHNEQQRIFASHTGRRIVLSTNVAETSLTVPGIRYVIDTGLARISRYSIQSKVQRLPIEPVSQASANQRAGRCGRVARGICIRLYSEQDFLSRPLFTDPEIQRTSLAAVILQMLSLKLGEINRFPFVEPPEMRAINDGFKLLDELGAISRDRQLTAVGRQMARLPADPRLSRMLIEASRNNCMYAMLIIVSALSVQDPRDTPADKKQLSRERHKQFSHPESDFLSWVLLWDAVETRRQDQSKSEFKQFCKDNFLSVMRLREWRETHRQLSVACQDIGSIVPHENQAAAGDVPATLYQSIHRAILSGSLNQLGFKSTEGVYTGSRGRRFSLFPASVLFKKQPRWIVSAELIETSKLFATMAARIEPEWAAEVAGHLIKKEYFDPHWEKKRGEVVAYEKLSLSGLTLIEKRQISFSAVEPEICREIFIREALVAGQLDCQLAFFKHNQALLDEVRRQEEKERKPDILVSDDVLFSFYDQRLPANINSLSSVQNWYRTLSAVEKDTLNMSLRDIAVREIDASAAVAFPDQTVLVQNPLAVRYRFEPGSDEDGVSIDVPVDLLAGMESAEIEWAVPGLVQERCIAMIKGLPKSLRKNFVPVPEFVNQVFAAKTSSDKPALAQILADAAWRLKRIRIEPTHWDYENIPGHLLPRLRVLDQQGKVLAVDHDLEKLKRTLLQTVTQTTVAQHKLERSGLTDWVFDDLPSVVEIRQGLTLLRYPAIQDNKDSVSIILCESANQAREISQHGVARLLMLRTSQQKALILKQLRSLKQALGLKLVVQEVTWQDFALLTIYRLAFHLDKNISLTRQAFEQTLADFRSDLIPVAERICRLLREIYQTTYDIHKTLSSLSQPTRQDVQTQLQFLVDEKFPSSVPDAWLWEYPRYLKALKVRIEKAAFSRQKEDEHIHAIAILQAQYADLLKNRPGSLPEFQWLIQELRVSLFAQALGTKKPVSVKKLANLIELAKLGDTQRVTNL
ncbi:ATP-dependent RNA helicase HrpA [Gammaproteobacteria bacterium LSUCC0112]|nr:ATP-dependent RNA helicase HrpA [Gammaproteobacteria bacterium LSUCC0112]